MRGLVFSNKKAVHNLDIHNHNVVSQGLAVTESLVQMTEPVAHLVQRIRRNDIGVEMRHKCHILQHQVPGVLSIGSMHNVLHNPLASALDGSACITHQDDIVVGCRDNAVRDKEILGVDHVG